MLTMAVSSVWMISNRGLYELWFYVTQFARYPAEIYYPREKERQTLPGTFLYIALMFVFPILLAINVPARYGRGRDSDLLVSWELVAYLFGAAAVTLYASRRFFFFALTRYRSASS